MVRALFWEHSGSVLGQQTSRTLPYGSPELKLCANASVERSHNPNKMNGALKIRAFSIPKGQSLPKSGYCIKLVFKIKFDGVR